MDATGARLTETSRASLNRDGYLFEDHNKNLSSGVQLERINRRSASSTSED